MDKELIQLLNASKRAGEPADDEVQCIDGNWYYGPPKNQRRGNDMTHNDHRDRLDNLVIGVLADADYPSREQKREAEKALAAAVQQAIDDWVDANVAG